MDIGFAMELLFQVVPPDDSQVVRVPAMGLDHEPTSAIGPIDVEDRVIHSVEVCCCGPEQDQADGRMNGLEMSLCDEAHRRAPGLEVESVVWTLCVVNMNRVLSSTRTPMGPLAELLFGTLEVCLGQTCPRMAVT